MSRRRRKQLEIFNLSFLDVISCGFGAIILLLVMARLFEPQVIERTSSELSGLVIELQAELQQIRGETRILNRELAVRREQLAGQRRKLARLQGELTDIEGRYRSAATDSEAGKLIAGRLESARQQLDAELRRLNAGYRRPAEKALIGGVPVDSEYIIFIIDTSGSMQQFAWPLVRQKMREILEVHPRVKGIQVLNDMGDYLFSQYAGRWIPDSKARRRAILQRLASWQPFSNSSPVEGVVRAIRRFYAPDKRISLYVFGDDFAAGDMQAVVEEIRRRNAVAGGGSRVRIHTIGFPVQLIEPRAGRGAARFAALMRRLAEENNGSFVGLSGLR